VLSTLYLDYSTSGYTNPIIFFICTVVFPISIAALANRIEGKSFTEFLGFTGTPIFISSMMLMSAGIIGMIFFVITRPLSILLTGTSIYSTFLFMFLPLSSKPFWFLAMTPLMGFVFYAVVAVGEEILKLTGTKIVANWLYDKTNGKGKNWIITIGFLISLLGWMGCHIFSWGSLPILGVVMGILLSVAFISPMFFAEPLTSPGGFQLTAMFSIWAPIAGHLTYDFLLSMMTEGTLAVGMSEGILISFTLLIVGGGLLAYQYFNRTGIFRL